ncbi:MAG: polysulfide reductase NrfD [Myxococcales bacterium]|nr:polysulfide reductase NrfD [Myxococcales bacterium]MCB9641822.1 polysulfide reductase NrfD [Myxococcales bacterium]
MWFFRFFKASILTMLRGGKWYYLWLAFLLGLLGVGCLAYWHQFTQGLIVTGMRDPLSWAFYIGNFTFMDGLAVTTVLLVVPAYFYDWRSLHTPVVLGQLLAVCCVVMAMLFVTVDIGRPDRSWHLIPWLGVLNFPRSILAWDISVLVSFMALNVLLAFYALYRAFLGKEYNRKILFFLIALYVPLALGVQTIAAFLYVGLPGRPYWNAAILVPKFIASALCAGPALLLLILQVLQKTHALKLEQRVFEKIAEWMTYAMAATLLLFGAEVFKEMYSDTKHAIHMKYLFFGLHGKTALVKFAWGSLLMQVIAFALYLSPKLRKKTWAMNLGALLIYFGVYLEKGIILVVPAYTPSALGIIYEYQPSWVEWSVSAGVFALGFLLFTLMVKVAIPVMQGELQLKHCLKVTELPMQDPELQQALGGQKSAAGQDDA